MKELFTIIAAAGKGKRVGADVNKAFLHIGKYPMLVHTLKALSAFQVCEDVAVVVGKKETDYAHGIIEKYKDEFPRLKCKVVAGGAERQDSVYHALKSMDGEYAFVAVHDGARPFVSEELFSRVYTVAREKGAAIPVIKGSDTVKIIRHGLVESTFDRNRLAFAQTPQIFSTKMFLMAYENAYKMNFKGTDDASVVEFFGFRVSVVDGDNENIKVTTPADVKLADMRYKKDNEH